MRLKQLFLLPFFLSLACNNQAKRNAMIVEPQDGLEVSKEALNETNNDQNPTFEVQFKNVKYVGYGSSYGRNLDSVCISSHIVFSSGQTIIFEDSIQDYEYHAKKDYFPRQLLKGNYVYYFIEKQFSIIDCSGEGSIAVFKFTKNEFLDSCTICSTNFDIMSKMLTNNELLRIIYKCGL